MSSERLLVEDAKRRAEVFKNLNKYMQVIAETVKELDEDAEVYLFGSVAEGKHLLSSDIDVLVVTDESPGKVISMLWDRGIEDPFEIHVVTKEMLELYKKRAKLLRIV